MLLEPDDQTRDMATYPPMPRPDPRHKMPIRPRWGGPGLAPKWCFPSSVYSPLHINGRGKGHH